MRLILLLAIVNSHAKLSVSWMQTIDGIACLHTSKPIKAKDKTEEKGCVTLALAKRRYSTACGLSSFSKKSSMLHIPDFDLPLVLWPLLRMIASRACNKWWIIIAHYEISSKINSIYSRWCDDTVRMATAKIKSNTLAFRRPNELTARMKLKCQWVIFILLFLFSKHFATCDDSHS